MTTTRLEVQAALRSNSLMSIVDAYADVWKLPSPTSVDGIRRKQHLTIWSLVMRELFRRQVRSHIIYERHVRSHFCMVPPSGWDALFRVDGMCEGCSDIHLGCWCCDGILSGRCNCEFCFGVGRRYEPVFRFNPTYPNRAVRKYAGVTSLPRNDPLSEVEVEWIMGRPPLFDPIRHAGTGGTKRKAMPFLD